MATDDRIPGDAKRKMKVYECTMPGCTRIAYSYSESSPPECPVHGVLMVVVEERHHAR